MNSVLFIRDSDFSWSAREILREIAGVPHLLLRVNVAGPYYPERNSAPFIRIGQGKKWLYALMTEIDEQQVTMRGYFPIDVALKGRIEFGYGSEVLGSLPILRPKPERLVRARIESKYHAVTLQDPGAFAKQISRQT